MADVRKLLAAERAARNAQKPSAKRPRQDEATSSPIAAAQKRRRTSPEEDEDVVPNDAAAGLPAGFFDDAKRTPADIVVGGNEKPPTPMSIDSSQKDGLPTDFFSQTGGGHDEPKEVDEDEWAAFQAEVAAPAAAQTVISAEPVLRGQENVEEETRKEDFDEEEIDDAKERLLEEFDEMQTLEQRVQRLKTKREELRKTFEGVQPMDTGPISSNVEDDMDDDEDDEDEDEDDWIRGRA